MPAIFFGHKAGEEVDLSAASLGLPCDYRYQVPFFKVLARMFGWRGSKPNLAESASKASIISVSSFSDLRTGPALEAAAIRAARLPSSVDIWWLPWVKRVAGSARPAAVVRAESP